MTIKIYDEPMPENVQEVRYLEEVYIDAVTDEGVDVKVVDKRKRRIVTETQIDSELERAQTEVTRIQSLKDEITALKEE